MTRREPDWAYLSLCVAALTIVVMFVVIALVQ